MDSAADEQSLANAPADAQAGATLLDDGSEWPSANEFGVVLPALVLSDLHLGHPATSLKNPRRLQPLLDDARTAVFNGDACELLSVTHRERATDCLRQLAELCTRAGVRPLFIAGNHDPSISNLHTLDLCGHRVCVTHGDALHPAIAPWSRDAAHLRQERRRLLAGRPEPTDFDELQRLAKQTAVVASRYEASHRPGRLARVAMVGRFAVQPWRAVLAMKYWRNVSRYACIMHQRFCPRARLLIVGHTHRPGIWNLPGFTLVNTGSFQPFSSPFAVRLDDDAARVFSLKRRHKQWVFERELHRSSLGMNAHTCS